MSFYKSNKITFYNLQALKQITSYISRKTATLKILVETNVFIRDPFKSIKLSNLPPITIIKTGSTANVSQECVSRIFKTGGRASVMEPIFSQVTGFLHSRALLKTLLRSWQFRKVVHIEILRQVLFTGVAGRLRAYRF